MGALTWFKRHNVVVSGILRLGKNARLDVVSSAGVKASMSVDELQKLDPARRIVTEVGTARSATAKDDGKTIVMAETGGDAAQTHTLPNATGSGLKLRFVVGVVNTSNYLIKVARAADTMVGLIVTCSTTDDPDLAQPWPAAATSDTITLNGTTTGGEAVGDYIELEDYAANKWRVLGFTTTSGAEATPFSATVS